MHEDAEEDDTDDTLTEDDKTRIKTMAEESSATQKEIAKAFGIGRSTVSKIKNGAL